MPRHKLASHRAGLRQTHVLRQPVTVCLFTKPLTQHHSLLRFRASGYGGRHTCWGENCEYCFGGFVIKRPPQEWEIRILSWTCHTSDLNRVLWWLPCQASGVKGSLLRMVGPVSLSASSISVWQHVQTVQADPSRGHSSIFLGR